MKLALDRKAAVFEPRRNFSPGTPRMWNERILIDGEDRLGEDVETYLALLNPTSLSVEWRQAVGQCSLVGVKDAIAVLAGVKTRGFDLVKRAIVWSVNTPFGYRRAFDHVFVALDDDDAYSELDCVSGQLGPELKLGGIPEVVVDGVVISSAPGVITPDGQIEGDGMFTAVSLSNRRVLWKRDLRVEAEAERGLGLRQGTLPNQILGVGVGGPILGFSLADGGLRWKANVEVPYHGLLVSGGRVPVLSHGKDACNRFVVIDERTGELLVDREKWTGMVHEKAGSMLRDDVVAFPSESGHIAVFSTTTGECLAIEQTKRSLWTSTVVDDRLLVASSTGEVLSYVLDDGLAEPQEPVVPVRGVGRVDFEKALMDFRDAKSRKRVTKRRLK